MNKKEYHPDWDDIIRPQILKRDQYKCRHCGIRHKAVVYTDSKNNYVECDDFIERWARANGKKVFTLYLHVAHLDQDKNNNDPSNLVTLCPRHHSKFDAQYKSFKRIIKEHDFKKSKDYRPPTGGINYQAKCTAIRKYIFSLTSYRLTNKELEKLIKITTE